MNISLDNIKEILPYLAIFSIITIGISVYMSFIHRKEKMLRFWSFKFRIENNGKVIVGNLKHSKDFEKIERMHKIKIKYLLESGNSTLYVRRNIKIKKILK